MAEDRSDPTDGVGAQGFLDGIGTTEEAGTGPRLILIDLKLPRISGLTLLRRIRANERTRTIPVVVLTSSCESADLDEAYALGVNSYVVKPVDFDAYMDFVGRIGRSWMVLNEPLRG